MNNRCFLQHESGIAESRALLSSAYRATMQDHFPFVAFVEKTVAAYGLGRLQNIISFIADLIAGAVYP